MSWLILRSPWFVLHGALVGHSSVRGVPRRHYILDDFPPPRMIPLSLHKGAITVSHTTFLKDLEITRSDHDHVHVECGMWNVRAQPKTMSIQALKLTLCHQPNKSTLKWPRPARARRSKSELSSVAEQRHLQKVMEKCRQICTIKDTGERSKPRKLEKIGQGCR